MVVGVCLARVCGRLCLLFLLGRWRGGVVLVEACSFGVCWLCVVVVLLCLPLITGEFPLYLFVGSCVVVGLFTVVERFLLFFLLFERSLLLIVVFVVGFGYQRERVGAGFFLLLYLLLFSFPLFVCVVVCGGSSWFEGWSALMLGLVGVSFLAKLPLYGFHS